MCVLTGSPSSSNVCGTRCASSRQRIRNWRKSCKEQDLSPMNKQKTETETVGDCNTKTWVNKPSLGRVAKWIRIESGRVRQQNPFYRREPLTVQKVCWRREDGAKWLVLGSPNHLGSQGYVFQFLMKKKGDKNVYNAWGLLLI